MRSLQTPWEALFGFEGKINFLTNVSLELDALHDVNMAN